jgi:hypothetical protein
MFLGGWVGVKAVLRIAYSNKKTMRWRNKLMGERQRERRNPRSKQPSIVSNSLPQIVE